MEYVDAKTSESGFRYGEVDLELAVKCLEKVFIHQFDRRLFHHFRCHLKLVDGHDFAVDLDLGRGKRRKEKVRSLFFHHQFEQRFYIHRFLANFPFAMLKTAERCLLPRS